MCHGNRKSYVELDVIDHRVRRVRSDGREDRSDAITLGGGGNYEIAGGISTRN